jgi:hypothetical protein
MSVSRAGFACVVPVPLPFDDDVKLVPPDEEEAAVLGSRHRRRGDYWGCFPRERRWSTAMIAFVG